MSRAKFVPLFTEVMIHRFFFGEIYFFILNYRSYPRVYFRMTVTHMSKAGEKKDKPHPPVWDTVSLNIIFTVVPQLIFKYFISHHDSFTNEKLPFLK